MVDKADLHISLLHCIVYSMALLSLSVPGTCSAGYMTAWWLGVRWLEGTEGAGPTDYSGCR